MTYFTIVHILTLFFLFLIFCLFFYLAYKYSDEKLFLPIVFVNFLVMGTLAFLSVFVLDKYTKKARIDNFTQKRVLRNETIVFKGNIRNIGSFKIGKCELEIKLINNPISASKLGSADLYKPTSGLNYIKKDEKASTVVQKFIIAEGLEPKKSIPFTIIMPYPPYFSNASEYHYLRCR